MPAVTRVGDDSTADPCGAPPRPAAAGSGDVFTNTIPTVRVGDAYAPHACPSSAPHDATASSGSGNVFVNKIAVHRIGDAISCGSASATGSPNVFANDGFPIEFAVFNVGPLLAAAGQHAATDDPDSPPPPSNYPADTPPPSQPPQEEPVATEEEPTPVNPNCEEVTEPVNYDMQLSTTYTLGSFSTKAVFKHTVKAQAGLTLPDIVCNLKALANNVVEQINAKYPGARINSGFRTMTSGKSQHEKGMACDIQWPGISNQEYLTRAKWIVDNITFDQLIFEHGNSIWIHVSYNRTSGSQRKNVMTMKGGSYEPGLKLYYA